MLSNEYLLAKIGADTEAFEGLTIFCEESERLDIELFSDFLAIWSNIERLVLFCIEANFRNQILIGKHFSRSTRFAILCTAQISKFQQKSIKFPRILRILHENLVVAATTTFCS